MLKGGWSRVVLAALVLASAVPAVRAETKKFDFKKKSELAQWKSLRGEWFISSRGFAPRNQKKSEFSLATSIYDKRTFSDIKVEFASAVKFDHSRTSYVWLRSSYKSNGKFYEISGYNVVVYTQTQGDAYLSVEINRVKDLVLGGNRKSDTATLCASESFSPSFKDPELTVEAKGDEIKVLHKGKLICSAKDDTFKRGYVGFSAANQWGTEVTSIQSAKFVWSK